RQIDMERSENTVPEFGTEVALNLRGDTYRLTAMAPRCEQRRWKRRKTYGISEGLGRCPVGTGNDQARDSAWLHSLVRGALVRHHLPVRSALHNYDSDDSGEKHD